MNIIVDFWSAHTCVRMQRCPTNFLITVFSLRPLGTCFIQSPLLIQVHPPHSLNNSGFLVLGPFSLQVVCVCVGGVDLDDKWTLSKTRAQTSIIESMILRVEHNIKV